MVLARIGDDDNVIIKTVSL